jgi:rhodanese-related sulfurtransferase
VVAKFVPGLATLAPPMAGALGMTLRSFVLFDAVGAALWAGAGIAFGWVFHGQIGRLLLALSELGRDALWLLGALIALYVCWRIARRMRDRRERARIPRVTAHELAEMIRQRLDLLVLDVRAQARAVAGSVRIPGARHVDLADVDTMSIADWPGGAQVITYCDCPNDASATKAAGLLIRRGLGARVLAGGMEGWLGAGYPSEAVQ